MSSTRTRSRALVLVLALALSTAMLQMPFSGLSDAGAYTETVNEQSPSAPRFYYSKTQPHNSTLTGYVSHGWTRYRISMRGGSGDGTTDDCVKDRGWLPDGTYSNNGGDHGTRFDLRYKTDGDPVVRGWVWFLDSHLCSKGTVTRNALFIHSNGIEGTPWDGNYATAGCIKVSQGDRGHLADRHNNAYSPANGTMHVNS